MNINSKKSKAGFTIVELLIVMVIIAIIAAVSLVSYSGVSNRAVVASMQADLGTSTRRLKMYFFEHEAYPKSLDENYCPVEPTGSTDLRYCLQATSGNSYVYSSSSPYSTFSLKVTNGNNVWQATNDTQPGPVIPLTAIASIAGTAQQDSVLTAGALTPSGATASYRWQIASSSGGTYSDIAGATSNTYTPTAADVGKYIRVVATGTGSYSNSVTSSPTGAVQGTPMFTSGGTVTTSGGNEIRTFSPGVYTITTGRSGTINIDIKGAGGGGNGLNYDNCTGVGIAGELSKIVFSSNSYIANGGNGAPCYSNGSGGGVSIPGGFTNTATPATGGGSAGGAGTPWNGDELANGGTNGGAGGRVTGSLSVGSNQSLTITVGSGGAGGCTESCGNAGSAGVVVISYPQ